MANETKGDFIGEIVTAGIRDAQETLSAIYVQSSNDMSSFLATIARLRFMEASFIQSAKEYLEVDLPKLQTLVDAVQQSVLATLYTAKVFMVEEIKILYPNFVKPEINQELKDDEVVKAMKELTTSIRKLHS